MARGWIQIARYRKYIIITGTTSIASYTSNSIALRRHMQGSVRALRDSSSTYAKTLARGKISMELQT